MRQGKSFLHTETVGNVKCEQVEIRGLFLHIFICSKFIHMCILISCTVFFFKHALAQSLHIILPFQKYFNMDFRIFDKNKII